MCSVEKTQKFCKLRFEWSNWVNLSTWEKLVRDWEHTFVPLNPCLKQVFYAKTYIEIKLRGGHKIDTHTGVDFDMRRVALRSAWNWFRVKLKSTVRECKDACEETLVWTRGVECSGLSLKRRRVMNVRQEVWSVGARVGVAQSGNCDWPKCARGAVKVVKGAVNFKIKLRGGHKIDT